MEAVRTGGHSRCSQRKPIKVKGIWLPGCRLLAAPRFPGFELGMTVSGCVGGSTWIRIAGLYLGKRESEGEGNAPKERVGRQV
jgi:hypothetical protein